MAALWHWITNPGGLSPNGSCLTWGPGLVWLDAIADGLIGLSFVAIAVLLLRLARRRPDLGSGFITRLLVAFTLVCGLAQGFSVLTLWVPAPGIEGLVKAVAAIVSLVTVVALWPLVPKALALPTAADLHQANQALRASQGFLQRTGALAGVGGWEADLNTNSVTWSDITCELLNLPAGTSPTLEEAFGYFAPASQPVIREAVRLSKEQGRPLDLELPMISATGRQFWAHVVGSAEFENGRSVRIAGALQEITTRHALERELAEQRELLQVTLEAIGAAVGDAVITTDLAGRVRWLNSVAEALTGWAREDAIGEHVARIFIAVGEPSRATVQDPVSACLARSIAADRLEPAVLLSRNGQEYGIEDSAAPIRDLRGRIIGAVLVFRDVSEQRRLSAEMRHRATHDMLTGLANRAEFEAALTRLLLRAQEEQSSHALMYIDLDQFKLVNDTCGHAVGDQLLKQIGLLLRGIVRANDVVARLGGDEFGVLLDHCNVDQALRIGQNICKHLEEFRFIHDGRRFQAGASIGLVPVDGRFVDAGAVMQAADTSCYGAKDSGRNRVHVWFETDSALHLRNRDMDWVSRFSQALDEDRFELYGQIIAPITPTTPGLRFETLLRLRTEDGTLSRPAVFMLAAERFGMATRIDRWVVRRLLAWMEGIAQDAESIAMVTINLSGQSIGDRAFHRDIGDMIKQAKFDVRRLCFEITETAAITNFADAAQFIEEMRSHGIQIALDDFGAGTSSFGYLKILPVDYLKIDGQFITNLLEDDLDRATVRCFHDVARVIGVRTIAESVERQDVSDALQRVGIDMIQGFLVHRPEPLDMLLCHALRQAVACGGHPEQQRSLSPTVR
jgi:diguanylate cyclase (GGDEF)-like protein/PAS domain S-box-containing protein